MYLLEGEILSPNLGPKYTDVIEETSAIEYKARAANIHTVDYKTVTNPKGLKVKLLNLLEKAITGSTPPGSMSGMWDGEIQVVTPRDLGGVVKSTKRSVTEAGTSQSRSVRPRSLLACCIGATIGKVGIATRTVRFNQQINALEWNAKMDDFFGIICLKRCYWHSVIPFKRFAQDATYTFFSIIHITFNCLFPVTERLPLAASSICSLHQHIIGFLRSR